VGEQQGEEGPHELTELTRVEGRLDAAPERIGNYRILQKLGEGGMGLVYEAEQERPVRRRVALKVIKLGMDTEQVVVRFESERQALALMNHPAIARVYDAGATAEGRPYFAMECVKGVPITEYCRRYQLPTRERLELFILVCEGVQHAHQKGIIHRDIKPTNVLVSDQDGHHAPKIIDFGIAKATARRLTEKSCFTQLGQLIGTPEYMSPEQAEMSGLDIDTRTDVYQLGVLLYELLTGELPFPSVVLREAGFNEFRRKVLEEVPQRPSLRATRLAGHAAPAAGGARPPARTLRGDLDWITMKALEKDRTRRYASASELAADIGRHLRNEPVFAGPPSKLYRMRKFVRRHRTGVAFASVLVVLLAGFAGTMYVQWLKIRRANAEIARQAETSRNVSAFLTEMFKASDPDEARGREITAREILDRGARRIRDELKQEPAIQAELMSIIGDVYSDHGMHAEARALLEDALHIQETLNTDDLARAATMERLAFLRLVHGDQEEARRLYRAALEIRLARQGPDSGAVAASWNALGNVSDIMCDFEEAARCYGMAAAIWEKRGQHLDLATALSTQGIQLAKERQYAKARPLLERALEIQRQYNGPDHPLVAWVQHELGNLSAAAGEYEEARRYLEQALELRRQIYDARHEKVAESLSSLAILCSRAGQLAAARRFHDEAVAIHVATGAADRPLVLYGEAGYHAVAGARQEALALLRRAVIDHDLWCAESVRRDPNLDALHGEPEFEAILTALRQRDEGR
jgi:serine/threonine protein kinase/tetratricopeptide (TPR) repeat protein